MTNWKISMSLGSFMMAAIELLKIKDHYNPERITTSLVYLVVGFVLTVALALALLITGLKGNSQRRVES